MTSSNGWPLVPLGEIAAPVQRVISVVPGNTYRTLGVKWWGEGAYERQTIDGSQTAVTTLNEVRENDLIINKIWVRHGSVAVVTPEVAGCVGSNEFPTFEFRRDRALPSWLHWYSKTQELWKKCDALSQGSSGKNRIRPEKFLTIDVPLPPLDEQRRIVAKIDRLAARIEEADGLTANSYALHTALFASCLHGVISALVEKHGEVQLGSLNPHVTSGPRSWSQYYSDNGMRFYRAQDIGPDGGIINDNKQYICPPSGQQGRSAFVRSGDLFVVITGATVGRVAVFKSNQEPGFVSQHVAICRLPSERIVPEYALWMLRGPEGQRQLLGQRYGQGKPGLNLTSIRRILIPLPPLDEQRRVVAYLDSFQSKADELKRLQSESAAELNAMLPSILDRAFKGAL